MEMELLYNYCKSLPLSEETFPFGDETLVFKVFGKMFALLDLSGGNPVNLKCDPQYALELREQYSSIIPGYHMNKKHWNTILIYNNELGDEFIKKLTLHSYKLVVESLPKKQRELCEKDF